MIDTAIDELAPIVGLRAACAAVGRPRASHYRLHRISPAPPRPPQPEPKPRPRALTAAERQQVIDLLHSERFVDLAPGEVHSILLDEGRYLCHALKWLLRPGAILRPPRPGTHWHDAAARL